MTLTLEDLKDAMIYFSPIQSQGFTENCIVALENQNHASGCHLNLNLNEVSNVSIPINWSSKFSKNGYKEKKKFTEKAAEAISFLLAINYTEFNVIEEAIIGTGVDYWLGYEESNEKYDEFNFIQARLEISGILEETKENNLAARVKGKKKQTVPTDSSGLPVYISVVEFSEPKAYFAKK